MSGLWGCTSGTFGALPVGLWGFTSVEVEEFTQTMEEHPIEKYEYFIYLIHPKNNCKDEQKIPKKIKRISKQNSKFQIPRNCISKNRKNTNSESQKISDNGVRGDSEMRNDREHTRNCNGLELQKQPRQINFSKLDEK